ncbi:MAG: GNAT family N-acetyltransferase, partial [Verrucomicrobia bacterium]|nr:GNAT family N-acetyltransferase [Verrucomicrobiota bacterium]
MMSGIIDVIGNFVSMPKSLSLRPVQTDDEDLLFELFKDSRKEELDLTHWGANEKDCFLRWQYKLRNASFQNQFPASNHWIILADQRPIGSYRVQLDRTELRLIDIALRAEERGKGIGTILLRRLINESIATDKPIRLHVEQRNRAFQWYIRFGFR